MVKTALNSKRKLIYSIKWYAFIILQVVKFMHKRVTCKWFWAIYLSFHFVFGKFSSAILDKDLFTVTTFLLQSFFWYNFSFELFCLFHMTKGQGFLMEGSGLHDCVLSLSLSLSLYQVQSMRDNTDLVTIVLLFKFCIFIIIII